MSNKPHALRPIPARSPAKRRSPRLPRSQVPTTLKELIHEAPERPLTEHLSEELDAFMQNLYRANGGEGIAAFLVKRKPKCQT